MKRFYLFILACGFLGNLLAIESSKLIWELGYSTENSPDHLNWIAATVPGAVQLDIAKSEGYGPFYFGENWKDYLWMEDQEFRYRTNFPKPELEGGERLLFHSLGILKSILPEEELWPPEPGTSWESHHAYNAWVGDTWLMQGMIEDYFGKSANLEELISNGQLIQCEGYKAIYEEARRQKPYCSMALNWCYNEPWPTAANNSLINWPDIPKPGFYAVRDACRSVLESGVVKVKLVAGENVIDLAEWEYGDSHPNSNLEGPKVTSKLPLWNMDRFTMELEVVNHPEYNSSYTFLYSGN